MSVLDGIGDTPLVELATVVPPGSARVLAKLEWANPTGSLKDRAALAMVRGAEERGLLRPGGTVVEYSGGTTGISLALVCAARGYRLRIVFSDAFSDDKRRMLRALGAEVVVVPSEGGRITAELIRTMIETARTLSREPGHWWSDQFGNEDAAGGYHPLGEEIWRQSGGRVDALVHAVGTGHSIQGTAQALRRHRPALHVAAVEPAESAVLSGGPPGGHRIEGIGAGFVPPLWEPERANEVLTVSSDEARVMARRLAREEGIFAGTSSGANVAAALRVAERLGPGRTVVTLLADSGLRYLSTDVYAEEPAADALAAV